MIRCLLCRLIVVVWCLVCAISARSESRADEPLTGPATEKRFPPLVIPKGFKATLFACDPLIEYPSVIAHGPKTGTLFLAHDYVTGLGFDIVRRDEIRLLSDTDSDGYADKSVVYAGGFNSIQGLAYHDGTVFAMHAPLLTSLRDTNGDGVADERKDLLSGLGLTPEKNLTRLHCANGVTVGHDGWLYLSMGDNGTDVMRPEGDRLVLNGGGILRCRPSGQDLHIFATGLRNTYDVTLDAEQNVFLRDNENDGGDYLLRIDHSFHGADHGYPYLYYEHPDEMLPSLAILGRGSSAGAACYLETAFPPEMHGNLFFCEWGRAVVRAERKPLGGGFAPTTETDFATTAPNDPYGFKPTDVIVDRDGSLVISDWGDGQRPKRGRGRIYRITYGEPTKSPSNNKSTANATNVDGWLAQLDSPSYSTRSEAQAELERLGPPALAAIRQALLDKKLTELGRSHAVWLLAHLGGRDSVDELLHLAATDESRSVQAQAVRAIADLSDPQLVEHRVSAGVGDGKLAGVLASLMNRDQPRVFVEIVTCLGRLKWPGLPNWLQKELRDPDATTAHAAQQALRHCGNWPAVLSWLDEPDTSPLRAIALRAIADQPEAVVVDGLIERLRSANDVTRRRQYAEALSRVYQKPAPWTYWGYRPGPRPANTVAWERTTDIGKVLNGVLADTDFEVRAAILQRMLREHVPVDLAALRNWLQQDRNENRVAGLLDAVAKDASTEASGLLESVIRERAFAESNRLTALTIWTSRLKASTEPQLLVLARQVEDGVVLQRLVSELGQRPQVPAGDFLLGKLDSPLADVRAAALSALTQLKAAAAIPRVSAMLADSTAAVRRAAVSAAGVFEIKNTTPLLLTLAKDADPAVRGASLEALRKFDEPAAVEAALDALAHPASQISAIRYLSQFGSPDHVAALVTGTAGSRSNETLQSVAAALAEWSRNRQTTSAQSLQLQMSIAKLHGDNGNLLLWRARWPVASEAAARIREPIMVPSAEMTPKQDENVGWSFQPAAGSDLRIELSAPEGNTGNRDAVLAYSDLELAEATGAQFLTSGTGTLQIWLNGRSVYQREKPGSFQTDSDRFDAQLNKGLNRVVVQLSPSKWPAQFHLRFRRKGSSAEHERLTQFSLQSTGNVERGRELFFNAEKTQCMKCHRLADQGGKIGPDLTGIGSRFARIHIIESILEPSRTIAPSYETTSVALVSGRVITGVKVSETDSLLVLGDEQGKSHEIAKSEIDERLKQTRSTMPDGLEKRITSSEFLDLLTFLVSQKKP